MTDEPAYTISSPRELSFLYTPHCHDLFYITVKYHQNIRTVFMLQSGHENVYGKTDARLVAISPKPFGRGDKKDL